MLCTQLCSPTRAARHLGESVQTAQRNLIRGRKYCDCFLELVKLSSPLRLPTCLFQNSLREGKGIDLRIQCEGEQVHVYKFTLKLVSNGNRGRVKSCLLSLVHDTGSQEKVSLKRRKKGKESQSWALWCRHVIPTSWKAEAGRLHVQDLPGLQSEYKPARVT